MKKRWSKSAGMFGALVTIALALPTDIAPNIFITSLLCPPVALLGVLLRIFPFSINAPWAIVAFILICAALNAVWYGVLAAVLKLVIEKVTLGNPR
jgi:hypothetical protein